jgi:enolase-phosphatase E1
MSAILLDIEGTVSDRRFVANVLFPYARARIRELVVERGQTPAVAAALRMMTGSPTEIASELERWIDEDRKLEPLKTLQGLIWAEGYGSGELVSHIYPDVPPALTRWRAAGKRIAIFSSGSIAAQQLLFRHTERGDLTSFLESHFDLSTGPKIEAASYAKIAGALGLPAAEICFYSDFPAELAAARRAGMAAVLVERDGPISGADAEVRRIHDLTAE